MTDSGAKPDAKKPPIDDDAGDDPPTSCLNKDPIDPNKYPYAKAAAPQGACSTDDAAQLSAYYKTVPGKESVATWKTKVNADCAKCVFSDGTGATWTPIITAGDKLGTVNVGGCIEAQGLTTACGKAYQAVTECAQEACGACQTQEEYNACRSNQKAIFQGDGPCKAAAAALGADCDQAKLGPAEEKCLVGDWTFDGPIKIMCVDGAKADAGADGG